MCRNTKIALCAWKAVAALLGLSIPILIYLGTRTWAALTIENRRAA
jgi:hypothetical protein